MCLLTFFPEGVQPDPEALANGARHNQDGHGYAIVTPKGLIIRKGLDPEAMISQFVADRWREPSGPALFHSRFGTGGVYTTYNVHPFRLHGDRRTVVAHNGILPALVQPDRKDKRCDTRIAASDVFPTGFGDLNVADNRLSLANWIGKSNKLVFLTVNPRYDEPAYIINESSGEWHGGVWYSNCDYQAAGRYGWYEDDDEQANCEFCESVDSIDYVSEMCVACGTCVHCGEVVARKGGDCECYPTDPEPDDEHAAAMAAWADWVWDKARPARGKKLS